MSEHDYPLRESRGIGGVEVAALGLAGIITSLGLLEACATPRARADLARRSGLDGAVLLGLANRADLMRVKGIGTQWATCWRRPASIR